MPEPKRGTAEWLQDMAARVEAIRIDMAWMHPVDGDLTDGQMANVVRLGTELAAIAGEMEGTTKEYLVVGKPAHHGKRISYVEERLDDVAITCDLFRLEQMDNDAWWAAAYRGEKRTTIWLRWDRKTKNIVGNVVDDSIPADGMGEA